MAVKIRLTRTGRKKAPCYRVVVADSQSPRDGKYLERVGLYAPRETPALIQIDEEVALKWLRCGALPTETVKTLFQKQGVWKKFLAEKQAKAAPAKA